MRDNAQRAKLAKVLLIICAGTLLINGVSDYFQLDLLNRMDEGYDYTTDEAESNDMRVQLLAIAYLIIYIISGVTFIQWFRRAYYNLHTKVKVLNHTEGWAAGGWFVPILNLFRPYNIMSELYQETNLILAKNIEGYRKRETLAMTIWWVFWIIWGVADRISSRMTLKAETMEELISSTEMSLFISFFGIGVAILAYRVVSEYSEMEQLLFKVSNDDLEKDILDHLITD